MIETALFDKNPLTGLERWFHYDDETGMVTFETRQDVQGIMEAAKERYNAAGDDWKGDWHSVGYIPLPKLYELQRLYPDPKECERQCLHWLTEHNHFKTRPWKQLG